jgi:hypothetical protein
MSDYIITNENGVDALEKNLDRMLQKVTSVDENPH